MRRTSALCAAVAIGLFAFRPDPAEAQTNYHTWFSRTGSNTAGCGDIAAPCRDVSYAVDQTVAGGMVECLDAVDRAGKLSVLKSITITCDGAKMSNSTGTNVYLSTSISVAASDVVTLR